MKRLVRHTVNCMSKLNPRLTENLSIEVIIWDGNEGEIPHVHVYHDKTRNKRKCSVVQLDKAEYSPHHRFNVAMTRDVKRQFVQVMTTTWPGRSILEDGKYRHATGYEAAVTEWVDAFEHGSYDKFKLDDNGVPVMPDYNKL